MPWLHDLVVPIEKIEDLTQVAAQALGVRVGDVTSVRVARKSIDARHRRPRWVLTLAVGLRGEAPPELDPRVVEAPLVADPARRVVIVGTGPAGLFAALRCADAGMGVTILDRGGALKDRHRRSRRLRAEGELDPETNLCFGEGGAGTYSDGKLYTRKKDDRVREVYERLVAFGATTDILVEAHPHVGTNELIPVIAAMHEHLEARGTRFVFDTRVDDLIVENGRCRGVVATALATGESVEYPADAVLFATGHSARDTYTMLARRGVRLERKPFAVGARVEHPQALIDRIQFGDSAGHPSLGAAEYFLKCQVGGRGIYSFCMCPGGFIIPTPTEVGHLNVNGMSNASRANGFSNAALVVTVNPDDCAPSGDALDGLLWQRAIERKTFLAGGGQYAAPATRLTDFARGKASTTLPERTSYRPKLTAGDIGEVLPDFVSAAIRAALTQFDRNLRGYLTSEAIIVASETTTSSPIRIPRTAGYESVTLPGLYPVGEGAGYAGGIVSSAIDGMNAIEAALGAPR